MQLTITPLGDAGVAVLPPDILWNGTSGDFAVSTTQADGGAGGLVAKNPYETAVLLLLFTDARADLTDLRFEHHGDRRGWVGDAFDVDAAAGEAPLGSFLWLLRRTTLNPRSFAAIKAEVLRALNPLIAQGAAVRIDVDGSTMDQVAGRVALAIDIYGRDRRQVYAGKFDFLLRRADGL